MFRVLRLTPAVLLLLTACADRSAPPSDIRIEAPRATPTRGEVRVNAGYFLLRNAGAGPDRLLSAASPDARQVQLHTHVTAGGVARMVEVTGGIEIPAGGSVRFAPGGYHLMIFDPARPLSLGDRLPVVLTFQRAGEVQVVLPVEPPAGSAHAHH